MLTLIALSLILSQEPPAPPSEERQARVFLRGSGAGGMDKDGDGQVTREEFTAPMGEAFAELDKDGNGRLSEDERAGGRDGEHVFRFGGPEGPDGERRFELRRPGGSGEEREVIVLGGPGERMRFDDDGAGERRVDIRRFGGPDGPGEMDKDGDGKVSEAEFTAPLRDAFARMDADRSGFIDEGERGGDGDVRVFTHRLERREGRED